MIIFFAAFFIIIGLIVTILAVLKQKNCTSVTIGKVVDISRDVDTYNNNNDSYNSVNINGFSFSSSSNHSVSLYPIIEYEVDGNTYVKKSSTSSNRFHIGQNIQIHYNPENPDQYYIKSLISQIISGIICSIMGIVFIIIALIQ